MNIKNILIPTDFSDNAENAISYALAFLKNREVNITFLHAYHFPVITPEMPMDMITETMEDSNKAIANKLAKLCDDISGKRKKIDCDYVMKQESVSSACKKIVQEKNIDLIVMGTHGATGLKKLLFGSNAASVIESATCPVLAIPEKAKFWKMKTMLFATDYHNSDIEDIVSLVQIAEPMNAEVIVVHISEGKEPDSKMLRWFEGLVRQKVNYHKLLFSLLGKQNIVKSLDHFIDNNEVELLAMSTRNRSPFEKFFSPGLTKRMAYHTSIPLLAFHTNEKKAEKSLEFGNALFLENFIHRS